MRFGLVFQPLLVDAPDQDGLGVLVVDEEVLLLADHEILDAARDGMAGVHDLHLVGAEGRVAGEQRPFHVAEIRVPARDVARVVEEPGRAAVLDEVANGLALLRREPVHGLLVDRRGRVADDLHLLRIVEGIGRRISAGE